MGTQKSFAFYYLILIYCFTFSIIKSSKFLNQLKNEKERSSDFNEVKSYSYLKVFKKSRTRNNANKSENLITKNSKNNSAFLQTNTNTQVNKSQLQSKSKSKKKILKSSISVSKVQKNWKKVNLFKSESNKNNSFLRNKLQAEAELLTNVEPADQFVVSIPIKRNKDSSFTSDFKIGTPPIVYTMLIDTGSSNVVLSSVRCNSSKCKLKTLYNPERSLSSETLNDLSKYYEEYQVGVDGKFVDDDSNTFRKKADKEFDSDTVEIEYGAGDIEGVVIIDKICVNSQLCVEKMPILSSIREELGGGDQGYFDGIVGLDMVYDGFDADNNLIHGLFNEEKIKNKMFSMYLNDDDEGLSELSIGGINRKRVKMDEVFYFNIRTDDYWEIEIKNVFYGESPISLCEGNKLCTAIIDSGTTGLALTPKNYRLFVNQIGLNKHCGNVDDIKNLSFELVDKEGKTQKLVLEPKYFVEKFEKLDVLESESNKYECSLSALDLDIIDFRDRNTIVLGNNFMKKYYSVFDKENNYLGLGVSLH